MTNFNIWSYCLTLMGGVLTYTENDYSRLTFGGANNYTYNPARPYAVASVQGVSHFPAHSQAVTYNAAQQPTSISEGGIETTIGYSYDMQRSCMTATEGDTVTLTQYYDNASYQRMTRTIGQSQPQTKELLYVGGDPYTAPAVMLKDYGENQWTLCYILRDNLGSVVSVADTLGNDLQHLSYDAWGRLRDPLRGSGIGACTCVTKLRFVSLRSTRLHGVLHHQPSPTTCGLVYFDTVGRVVGMGKFCNFVA